VLDRSTAILTDQVRMSTLRQGEFVHVPSRCAIVLDDFRTRLIQSRRLTGCWPKVKTPSPYAGGFGPVQSVLAERRFLLLRSKQIRVRCH
jgi:hypothetical protein